MKLYIFYLVSWVCITHKGCHCYSSFTLHYCRTKRKKNMHWAFYTWQTFLNWENYGQEWYSLRSYGSWCHLMPSWRMPCTVMTTWFHIVFTTTSLLYLYSSSTVTIQSLFDTTSHARLAPVPLQVGEVSHQNERFFLVNSIPLQYFLTEWHSLWYSKPTAGELGAVWFAPVWQFLLVSTN